MKTEFLYLCGAMLVAAIPTSQASAERLFGLTTGNEIVTFDSTSPTDETSRAAITGLVAGDVLTGIDQRPATRTLYSVATSGRVYSFAKTGGTYTATVVGTTSPMPAGTDFGIDFNPTVDRIRLVSNTNQNLRINPTNGGTLTDTAVTLNGSSTVDLIGAAYTNSFLGAATTVLYGLDSLSDRLVRATNANAGTYVSTNVGGQTFGALGVGFTNNNFIGFDISGSTNAAFFGVDSALYGLDLMTGAATSLGTIGSGTLVGLTTSAVPEPATWALMLGGFGLVGAAMRRRSSTTIAA